jgi:hypothetical protein
MRRVMMMSLIAAASFGGQNRAAVQVRLHPFQPASVTNVVQLKTGSISGVISDPNLHPVAGATVTAVRDTEAASTLKSFSTVSDSKGCFRFEALPIGTYEIQFGSDEIWLMKRIVKQAMVRSSQNTTVDLQLQFIDECDGNAAEAQSLSDSDRAEIVKWMLEEALTNRKIPSYVTLASDKKNIVLSTANIESSWVPEIPGHRLLLLTPAEVQKRATNGRVDYMYLEFDKIRARGSCVAVSIHNLWADGTSSIETGKKTFLGEGSLYYVFRKQSGRWIGKFITGRIS